MTDLFSSVNLIKLEGLKLLEGFSRLQLDVPTRTHWLIIITVETAMSSHPCNPGNTVLRNGQVASHRRLAAHAAPSRFYCTTSSCSPCWIPYLDLVTIKNCVHSDMWLNRMLNFFLFSCFAILVFLMTMPNNLYGFGIILTLMLLIFSRLFFIHLKLEKLLYLLKIYIFKYNY